MFSQEHHEQRQTTSAALAGRSFLASCGVVMYIAIVAYIIRNGERLFGEMQTLIASMAFLLLFCVSAAVVGSLVFGYPTVLFLGGQRRAGIMAAAFTIGWLALETILALTITVLRS